MVQCPTCGAGLRFDIASQLAVCDHCQNRFDPKEIRDNFGDEAKTEKAFDSFVFVCPSCGAELDTTDKNDAVGFCPYCGGASMIFDKIRRDWIPEKVVPFQITKEQCKEKYIAEVKKFPFVSRKFRDPKLIESFRGIYMPYCDFEGAVDGKVTLQALGAEKDVGNYYYETNLYEITGNAKYIINGGSSHDASIAFDDHISERVAPFDPKKEQDFRPAYLSGFYAETGNIDMNEYGPVLLDKMIPTVAKQMASDSLIKNSVPGDNISVNTSHSENRIPMKISPVHRKLFPVWFMSYRVGDKITYAAVNGESGKVVADLPLSPLRILIAALICSAAIFGLLFLLMSFLPTLPAATTLAVCTMLGFTGMYVLQHSYINTVGGALNQDELKKKMPISFIVFSVLATVGLILITTDGTYEQMRWLIGMVMAGFSMLSLVTRFYIKQATLTSKIKKIELKGQSMQTNGILIEAKRFNVINNIVRIITFITLGLFLPIILDGTWGSGGFYALSGVAAAELFVLALLHIRFQSRVALRRLPQFNKKGAAYDEK